MPDTRQPLDTLLHIADLHFWQVVTNPLRLLNKRFLGNLNVWLRRRREFAMDRAGPFADAVAATGIDQVLLTGDFTSTSTDAEFSMAVAFVRGLRERGLTLSLVPGNHDVYTFEAVRKRRFEEYFAEFLAENGYPSRTTLRGGTPLILVPTVCPNLLSARGRVTAEAVEVVAGLLEACGDVAVVAGHYPLLYRTYGYASGRSHRLRNANALRKLLGSCGRRILYLCGHVHRFSYVADADYPSLAHVSTGAFFRRDPKRGRMGEFTEIHVLERGFEVFCHTCEDHWIRRPATQHRSPRG